MKSSRSSARRRLAHPSNQASRDRSLFRRLLVESLEERRVMATLTWVGDVPGAGNNVLWGANNAGNTNWFDGVADALPADGDTLVFDGNGATFALTNDIAGLDNLTLQFTDAAAGGDYSIAGNTIGLAAAGITSSVTTGIGVTITAPLDLDAAAVAIAATAGNLNLPGDINGASALTITTAAGTTTLGGAVDVSSISAVGNLEIGGGTVETTGNQTYAGPVTLLTSTVLSATGAAGTISFATSLAAVGASNITLSAREINLPAVANTVSGAGSITLQPEADATPINIGAAADADAASLDITAADIAALSGVFAQITIGRAVGTAPITVAVAGANFGDALTLRATGAGGDIVVNGTLRTTADGDAGAIILAGPGSTTTLNADIVTAGAPITISDAIILGAAATIRLDTTNTGAVAAGANITLNGPGTVDDDVAGSSTLIFRAGAGDILVAGAVGGTDAPAAVTIVSGDDVNFNGTLHTTGNVMQTAGSGTTTLSGTSGIGIGGNLNLTTNAVLFATAAFTTVGNISISAQNAVTLNAPVSAGAGTIAIAANQDGVGTQDFTMNAGSSLATTNNSPTAVSITVNTAGGGNGNANIRGISAGTTAGPAGGRITIVANAGAIVDADASATVNLTAGNAVLSAAGGIGTPIEALETTLARLEANAGAPINITETNGLIIGGITGAFGITTSSDDVRLTVPGDLVIDEDISLGAGGLLLTVAGNVSQNAGDTIVTTRLALDVTGTTTLTEANNVSFLAADNDSTIDYNDVDGLTIDPVTVLGVSITKLTTSGDDVRLTAGGDLIVSDDIELGAGNLLLDVAGNVSQNAGDTIVANGLALDVDGTTTLTETNNVAILVADNDGAIDYTDIDSLDVGSVTVLTTLIEGLATSDDEVRLTVGTAAGHDLDVVQPISLNPTAAVGGDLLLDVGGNVSQSGLGTIVAEGLALLVTGTTTLTLAGNDVDDLAADNGGAICFVDLDDFEIDEVTVLGVTVTGVETSNADIELVAGAEIFVRMPLSSGTADLRLAAVTTVGQVAAGIITADELGITAGATVVLCAAVNDVNVLAVSAAGLIEFQDGDELIVGSIAAGVCGFAGATGLVSSDNDINLRTGDSVTATRPDSLQLDRPINAGTGDVRIVAGSGFPVADSRSVDQVAAGEIIADELGIQAEDDVFLCVATTNDVNTLAVNALAGPILIEFRDVDELIVGLVATGGDCGFTTATGLVSANGNINLRTGDSVTATRPDSLQLDRPINAGTGDVRIVAGSGFPVADSRSVDQVAAGEIIADELGIQAEDDVFLCVATTNDVNTLAVNALAGPILIEFRDVDELIVGLVATGGDCGFTTATGLVSANGNINLRTGDSVTATRPDSLQLDRPINAGTGDVRIVAGSGFPVADSRSVDQVAAGEIIADELGIQAEDDVFLCVATTNDVNTLAVNALAGPILIEFRDVDELIVGLVATGGDCGFTTATGLVSANGNINLRTGDSVTATRPDSLQLDRPINAGTGDVRIVAGAGFPVADSRSVDQVAAGEIIADELGIQAEDDVFLCVATTNDVNTLAVNALAGPILIEFRDVDELIVGLVATGGDCGFTTATGLVSANGNINLRTGDSVTATRPDSLQLDRPINAGTGDVRIVAGAGFPVADSRSVDQLAAGEIIADELGIQAEDDVFLCVATTNDVNTLAVNALAGPILIEFRDVDELIVGLVATGGDCGFTTATGLVSANGNINLRTGDSVTATRPDSLQLDRPINAGTGDVRIVAGSGFPVADSRSVDQVAAGEIIADELGIQAEDDVFLCVATTNDVNTLAVNALAGPILIEFRDVDELIVGLVATGGDCGFTTATGLVSANGNINLRTGDSVTATRPDSLQLDRPINAGTGDVRIVAGAGFAAGDHSIDQIPTAPIVADELGIRATDSIALCEAANDVNVLAIATTGTIEFADQDSFTVATVAAGGNCDFTPDVIGVSSGGNDIELIAGGSIQIDATIAAGLADVRLVAGGSVSQSASGNILADELGVRAGSGISLIAAINTNDVNQLAARSTTGNISFGDRDDLVAETVTDGVCDFEETIGVTALDGNVHIEVRDTAASGEDLTIAADVLAGTLPTDNDRSLTLRAGDNLTINTGINVLATGAVTIAADTHAPLADAGTGATLTILGLSGKIAGDLAAGNDVTITLGVDRDLVFLAPNRFDVNAVPGTFPAYDSDQMLVSLGVGDDRITLDYSENFGWSGPKMELTIDGGSDAQADTIDIDQTEDSRARKRQFVYATGQPADGTATNFTSDVQNLGGTFDNNDNLCVMIRQMDGYLVRASSASLGLDQTIIIGNQAVASTITVGDIADSPTPDSDLPAIITSPQFTGRARFGISGAELLRSIGGGQRDTIITGITPASGVTRNILEGQGSTVAGEGEILRGANNILNLFFGAGAVPLIGQAGANLDIGLEPERARLFGGAGNGINGDFFLADHRRSINADGTANAPVQIAGGNFRDLEVGAGSTAVAFGANDRAKAGPSVAGSDPVDIFINGEINVILWLQARFPGFAELGIVTGSGATPGSAESFVAQFDHNFLTCDNQPQTTIDQSSGGGPGPGPGPGANNVTATVSGNKLTLTGDAAPNDLLITLGAAGANSVRIEGRNGTLVNGLATSVVFTGLSKGILAKLNAGADRVTVEGSGFTPLVRIEGGANNDDYALKMTGASLEIVDSSGWDRLNLAELSTKATLNLSSTSTQSFGASSKLKISGTIEDLAGTAFNDTLTGNKVANNIFGLAGNDTIYGKDGNDYIDGGIGNDTLRGENHNDLIRGGNDNDKIYGGSGHDIILGELGNDELRGDSGRDLLIGGTGLDLLYGGSDEDILTAGTTSHDANDTALRALLAEWIKSGSTTSRANKLRTGQTVGGFALNLSQVQLDGQIDQLRGEGSNDWLLAPLADNDSLIGVASGDIVDR